MAQAAQPAGLGIAAPEAVRARSHSATNVALWRGFLLMVFLALFGPLLILLLFGILAGISGAFWTSGKLWIWAALVVLVGIVVGMYLVALPFFNNVRHAVGLATFDDVRKGLQPPEPVSASDLETLLASSAPMTTALIGVGGLAIITWLMVLKPF